MGASLSSIFGEDILTNKELSHGHINTLQFLQSSTNILKNVIFEKISYL